MILTASKLWLAQHCLYPWSGIEVPPGPDAPAARLGTAFHEAAATVVTGGELRPLPLFTKYRLDEAQSATLTEMLLGWQEWWERSHVRDAHFIAERPFAYNPVSEQARMLPGGEHRNYSDLRPGEIAGTADLVAILDLKGNLQRVGIGDWKTGQQLHAARTEDDPQMRFLALCAARAYEVEAVEADKYYVDADGAVTIDSHRFDAMTLGNIADEMTNLAARLGGPCEPQPGDHCRYCPAAAICPATRSALDKVSPPTPPDYPLVATSSAIQSQEHAAWLLHRLRAVQSAAEAVEAALKQYADEHQGIKTESGKTWSSREITVEKIVLTDQAVAELTALGLTKAVTHSATKTSIKAAAKAAGDKSLEARALETLREVGAVNLTLCRRYEER